ncbi:LysR family transcriptional regulator [Erwinia persicina]|uniref:LysR family transcriptional regulator n=1 Tax=Erwinia persicina TaxID=55211 RepID=UPI00178400FB|nr:LysR family transcriptional regulator [Erwinia persicina]MBD8213341.1 LysR family transcriptional regulator [Erwinia persicina]
MELRHLRYFVAVAEEKNFSRAALRLHISQPPLSRQIRQLEDDLGAELFVRASRPLALTGAGRFFYYHAVQLLAGARELKAMTRRIGQPGRTLTLGVAASTLYGLLPPILQRFRADLPQVALHLQETAAAEQGLALKDGVIDVGFGRHCDGDTGLRQITLRQEPLMVAMTHHHPLAGAAALTLHDLRRDTLLVCPQAPQPGPADPLLQACRANAFAPGRIVEVAGFQLALALAAAGEGAALVPACLQNLQRDAVVYRPLAEPELFSPVVMSTRQQDRSEDISRLLRLIYQLYEERNIPYIRPAGG